VECAECDCRVERGEYKATQARPDHCVRGVVGRGRPARGQRDLRFPDRRRRVPFRRDRHSSQDQG
jgi:hypothetical protein